MSKTRRNRNGHVIRVEDLLAKPKTANYRPLPYNTWGVQMRDLPAFTFDTVRAMLWDQTIKLGIAMRAAPLCNAEFAYKEGKEWTPGIKADKPAVAEYVERQLNRIWKHYLPKLIHAQTWGWSGGEVTYKWNTKYRQVDVDEILTRHAADIRALEYEGRLAGVRVRRVGQYTGQVDLIGAKGFWHAFQQEDGSQYGVSVLRGAYSAWADKWLDGMALDVRRLFMHKDAYGGAQLKYPGGTTDIYDSAGNVTAVPNQDIAQQIVEQAKSGHVVTLPSTMDASGKPLWEWVDPRVTSTPTHILEYPKDLDVEMLRGLEIPDDVLTSEATGAWAGKAVPQQAFYTGLDVWGNSLLSDIVRQLMEPLVILNFGRAEEFEACIKPLAEQASEQSGQKDQGGGGAANAMNNNPFGPQYGGGSPQMMSLGERLVGEGVVDAVDIVRHARQILRSRKSSVQRMAAVHAPHNMTVAGKEFKGGEIGPNGEHYPGGAFIATTELPKKAKASLEKSATGKVQVDGYQWEVPQPGKMSILDKLGGTVLNPRDGKINYQYLEYRKSTADEVAMYETVVEKWNNGERWVDVTEFPQLANIKDAARLVVAGEAVPGDLLGKFPEEVQKHLTRYKPTEKQEAEFTLTRESERPTQAEIDPQESSKQKKLLSGLDALLGQGDLFDDVDKADNEPMDLSAAIQPVKKSDLKKPTINLWHGTTLSAAKAIASGGLSEGSRGTNASADVMHAAQYPEETGAEAIVLLSADTDDLSVDPNDQIGETVEDGLFPKGFGSSATVGKHRVLAVIDINKGGDKAIKLLKKGDLAGAIKAGAKVIHQAE